MAAMRTIPLLLALGLLVGCPDSDACFDFDEDGWCDDNDCGPSDPEMNGDQTENCFDDKDNDCDGHVDGDDVDCSPDADGDGWTVESGDCDDDDPHTWPGVAELCDGEDNDCDGIVPDDEADADGDGVMACDGDCDDLVADLNLDEADADGQTTCDGDCDDGDPAVYAGGTEVCNGIDDDCDGTVPADEEDADADGVMICEGDCDDTDPAVHEGSPEICNGGIDDDCDPSTDENADDDGDGFSLCHGDCDDTDAASNPDALEMCDGQDDDCDGVVDDGCITCDLEVPAQYSSIQTAIDAGAVGASVCVAPGTYTEILDFHGQAVRVVGTAGAAATIVDGNGAGPVVTFENNEGAWSILQQLTITGGSATRGGGVYIHMASPQLLDVAVTGNEASEWGGGIYLDMASPTIEGGLVSDNEARGYVVGGGIALTNASDATLRDVVIRDNLADGDVYGTDAGGGIYALDSILDLDGVQIIDNATGWGYSDTGGGGIRLRNSTARLHGVVIDGNATHTNDPGAGLSAAASAIEITNSRISGNLHASHGGGLALLDGSSAILINVAVIGNDAETGHGGGFYLDDSDLSLTNAAIVGNTAAQQGGGVHLLTSDYTAVNTILDNNMASGTGGGIFGDGAGTFDVTWCAVDWNPPENFYGVTDPTGAAGNIAASPLFLDDSYPDPDVWDLHLETTSPLVDAGDPTILDPDSTPSDIGIYGGPDVEDFDLDHDGWNEWWQPGPYDATTYPAQGWDCDDRDAWVVPGAGC
jgi:hypothetical protein